MTSDILNDLTFSVPLTQLAHEVAQRFQQQQSDPLLAKQVYLNILAVYAVYYWLGCWGVETDIEASDSLNPIMQTLANTGELIVKNKGSLECRPVVAGSQYCQIPAEVWTDRIGYVVVELNSDLTEAQILGYLPSVQTEEVPLNQLQSINNLLDNLMELKPQLVVQLSRWLHNQFDRGWEALETFLENTNISPAFRSKYAYRTTRLNVSEKPKPTVERIKLLGSEIGQAGYSVTLLVALTPTASDEVDISVEVSPVQDTDETFQNLQAMVLDDSGKMVMESQAVSTQEIKFDFSGQPGDRFSIRVILDDVCLTESFAI